MDKLNLKNVLTAVRDMIMRNRVAYKDYLGTDENGNKIYDTKLVPVELLPNIPSKLLPKTLATKREVQAVENTADDALSIAYNAQNTADDAQTTATNAQTTATNAQATANTAKTTADDVQTAIIGCVKYTEAQTLTDIQKIQVKKNIGISDDYNSLQNRPCYLSMMPIFSDITVLPEKINELYYAKIKMANTSSSVPSLTAGFQFLVNDKTLTSVTEVQLQNSVNVYSTIYCIGNLHLLDQVGIENLQNIFDLDHSVKSINSPIKRPDNGLEFCIGSYSSGLAVDYGIITKKEASSYSVSKVTEIKTLDELMIPDTIARVGQDIILPSTTDGSTKQFKITVDDSGAISATEVT